MSIVYDSIVCHFPTLPRPISLGSFYGLYTHTQISIKRTLFSPERERAHTHTFPFASLTERRCVRCPNGNGMAFSEPLALSSSDVADHRRSAACSDSRPVDTLVPLCWYAVRMAHTANNKRFGAHTIRDTNARTLPMCPTCMCKTCIVSAHNACAHDERKC